MVGRSLYLPDLNYPQRLEGIATAMARRGQELILRLRSGQAAAERELFRWIHEEGGRATYKGGQLHEGIAIQLQPGIEHRLVVE